MLSVIVPSIRPLNLKRLYDSVCNSFTGPFKFIVIGPYGVLDDLKIEKNVLFIKDYGSPIRCQQIGLVNSSGDLFTWAADDGVYLPGALDIAANHFKNLDHMNVVVGKYREGDANTDPMVTDHYYYLKNHDASNIRYIPENTMLLNCGIVPVKLLREVGGWDAENFEVCPMAYSDLSIRLNRYGVNFILQKEEMFKCSHTPGHAGDHGPIHDAQIDADQPLFQKMYSDPDSENRVKIDIDNYKKAQSVWARRFGPKLLIIPQPGVLN